MQRQKTFLLYAATVAVAVTAVYLAVRYALVWLLPFLIAFILSALLNPIVEFCRQKMGFKRSFTSVVLTLALLGLVATIGRAVVVQLLKQAYQLATELPEQLTRLPALMESLQQRFASFCAACPEPVSHWAEQLLQSLSTQLFTLSAQLSPRLLTLLTDLFAKLPQVMLFCATTVLAVFFTLGAYPTILAFSRRQLSPQSLTFVDGVKKSILITLGQWLRAQLILIAITFFQLLLGFFLLGERYALLLAALIALIDALPVFGVGTVLLPWAVFCLLTERIPRALGLFFLYVLIWLVRNFLEPKLMAEQAGLPPLAALMAMYIGFCTLGVAGMIFAPMVLLLVKQLHDTGYLHLWK